MKVYLDHNLVSGIPKQDLQPPEELDALEIIRGWYKAGQLDLRISKLHEIELEPYQTVKMKAEINRLFSEFSQVPFVEDHELSEIHSQWNRQGGISYGIFDKDPTVLALQQKGLSRRDPHHVMLAIRAKCDVFLTCDERTVLSRREDIERQFPIRLMRPSALVEELTRGK